MLFLDLESSGSNIQVLVNAQNITQFGDLSDESKQDGFKQAIAEPCQRGSIVGIKGTPQLAQSGEYSVMAEEVSILA